MIVRKYPKSKNAEDEGPAIESVRIDERDVNGAESLQEKSLQRHP